MSDKNKLKNINTEEVDKTVENITKNLLKKTFEDDTSLIKNSNSSKNYKYNLSKYADKFLDEDEEDYEEYEDYDEDDDYDEEYDDSPTKSKNKYRKNIDKYGKEFFDYEDDDDYEKGSPFFKFLNIAIILALTISTAVLALSLKRTKEQVTLLKEENQKLIDKNQNIQDVEDKLSEDSLKNELTELQSKNTEAENSVTSEKTSEKTSQNTTNVSSPKPNTENNSNNSNISEYTVKEKDSFWKISQEVYGNGAYYQKIIEANNLTEDSTLTPGQKLKIPKIN